MRRIADQLASGRENAVPREVMAAFFGVSERMIRRMVAAERLGGAPILTDTATGGYYLPGAPAETVRFVRSMRHRGAQILRAADAVERTTLDDVGQMTVEGWDGAPAERG